MKIAICDDEAAVSDVTKSLLQQWAIHQSISLSVHCYENGDALTLMRSRCFYFKNIGNYLLRHQEAELNLPCQWSMNFPW